jgi:hypothetical protein
MKKELLVICSIFIMSLLPQSYAVDELPTLVAPHGGIIKKTSNSFLEVVQDKEHTSIYITGHDHKNITDQKLSLSAIALVNGKKYPMQLSFENDHYAARPANSYLHKENNFVLLLTITFSGKTDKTSFKLK